MSELDKEEIKRRRKERIKELRYWANDNLHDKKVSHPEFSEKIQFINKGEKNF